MAKGGSSDLDYIDEETISDMQREQLLKKRGKKPRRIPTISEIREMERIKAEEITNGEREDRTSTV